MTKRTKKTDSDDPETTSAMVMGMLGTGLERLETHITGSGKLDDESAAALAHLLTKVAMVAGELRKAEKAARDTDLELTTPQMLDRLRRMTAPERTQFMRSAQSLTSDAGKSGLS